jgi:hypothetical protein
MIDWKIVPGYVHMFTSRQFSCQIFSVYSIRKNRGQEGRGDRSKRSMKMSNGEINKASASQLQHSQ